MYKIVENIIEIQGTVPGTLLMLNGSKLNGYPLVFADNQVKTPNYPSKGILAYLQLEDALPQTICIVNNQNGAYEEIRQGEVAHIISNELPKESNSEEDKNTEDEGTETKDDSMKGEDENTNEVISQEEKAVIKVESLTISSSSKKIAAGKKVCLNIEVSPKNAINKEVVWKSTNKKYATVDSKGRVTTKKAGKGKTVTIYAEAKDGSGIKASYKIKIMKNAVTSIKIKNPPKTIKAGKSKKLSYTVKTNGKHVNKTLKWTSSNKKYATVDKKGKITAKKAGKNKMVTITVTSTDGTNKKARAKIKIR